MPSGLMLRYLHHKIIQELGTFIYFCVKKGKWGAYLRGKWDALRSLPLLLQKRKIIQARKKADNKYLQTLFVSILDRRLVAGKLKRLFSFKKL
jgi:hypothetical protein